MITYERVLFNASCHAVESYPNLSLKEKVEHVVSVMKGIKVALNPNKCSEQGCDKYPYMDGICYNHYRSYQHSLSLNKHL